MKKRFLGITIPIVTVLITALVFGGFTFQAVMVEAKNDNWPAAITLGSRSIGSSGYFEGVGVGQMIEQFTRVPVSIIPTAGSTAICNLMARGDAQMGVITAFDAYNAFRGQEIYKEKVPLRCIAKGGGSVFGFIVKAGSGINSLQDLKGKRVMGNYIGSEVTVRINLAFLHAAGLTEKDMKWQSYTSIKESLNALVEGSTDACGVPIGSGGAIFLQLGTKIDWTVIKMTDAEIAAAAKELPSCPPATQPKGTYKQVPWDRTGLSAPSYIWVARDLPEDFVYEITKGIFDNLKEFHKIHSRCRDYTMEDALDAPIAAYHAGAVKYWREKGKWTAELEKKQKAFLAEIGEGK